MKPFELSREFTTITGKFYPTGHILLMVPDAGAADAAGRALTAAGLDDDSIMLITPEVMMSQIVRTVGNADMPLPSPGSETDTVRGFAQYASQGHHALLVRASSSDDSDRVMAALKDHPISHAEKYHMLVIEDLA